MKRGQFLIIALVVWLCNSQAKAQCPDMAIHTNLIYDAFFIPNVGMDVEVGKGWTAGVNWHHAWWSDHLFCWKQTYGGDIHVDRHFAVSDATNPFDGHRLGIYGQLLTYDLEYGGDGKMADKPNYAIGLEYGYTLPMGKHLHLDLLLGVGYQWGEYKEYTPMWNEYPPEWHYVWQSTHRRNLFSLTKAEINLVWFIHSKGGKK